MKEEQIRGALLRKVRLLLIHKWLDLSSAQKEVPHTKSCSTYIISYYLNYKSEHSETIWERHDFLLHV